MAVLLIISKKDKKTQKIRGIIKSGFKLLKKFSPIEINALDLKEEKILFPKLATHTHTHKKKELLWPVGRG
jgi:hypothetical protein